MSAQVQDFTTQLVRSLAALKSCLAKGRAFTEAKKYDFSLMLQMRLAPDQFPLVRQVQIATDTAKGCAARLAGIDPPKMEDTETSYEQIINRIDRTIAFVQSVKLEQFAGWETRAIRFSFRPGVNISGRDYLVSQAMPNFFFHVTTAYAIMRQAGVDIGKNDFLGECDWKND